MLPPITATPRDDRLPLSFAQQRLWLLAQMEGVNQAYRIPLGLRLIGELDVDALRRALDSLVARHEALRTTFVSPDGRPVQRVATDDIGFDLRQHDLRRRSDADGELQRLVIEEANAAFDLEAGPLVRGRLIRLADREHVLLITLHDIISDNRSIGVLTDELGALYAAFRESRADPLPALPIQYPDYAVWERRWLSREALPAQGDYWRRTLAGAPALLDLPTDRRRPAQQLNAGAFVAMELDERFTAELKALSRRHGTTLFVTLLAGWAALLSRLSGQDDVVIGAPTANRGRVEVEPLIGLFVNNLALRLDLSGEPAVGELLERVKTRVLEAQQNQDLPFEQVLEVVRPQRSLAHEPVFQVTFAWRNNDDANLDLPGLSVAPIARLLAFAKFDLTLGLTEAAGRIVGGLEYATTLFDQATVERYAGYLRRLLEGMAADDAQIVDRLPLLGEAERHQLLAEWNATEARYPRDRCIHELFEAQADKTPDGIALVFGAERLTYAALNARANRMAHHLQTLGVQPDGLVAICAERGLEMVVGLLAILKAGSAYVPLDPSYPTERLAYMLQDSAPIAVLTHGPARAALERAMAGLAGRPPVLDLEEDAAAWADHPTANPEPAKIGVTSRHMAYVIYTSGSTGQPKGVMIAHRNVVRLFAATESWFRFDEKDVWTLFHSFAFDFSVWEIWGALIYGGRLVVVPQLTTRSPQDFYNLLHKERVTVLNQTPSAFSKLVAAQRESKKEHRLRYVIFGGEALEAATLKPWRQDRRNRHTSLINMYGITETTVHVTYYPLGIADTEWSGGSRIGRPIPDLKFYILDRYREPVPIGVVGEIHVGGAGVARGYLNHPELTAERFISSPFVEGDRLYRAGDLGRYLADGSIEFHGRNDFQVKIRGFRIELGEIEVRLAQHPAVREAVVLAREDTPGDKRLAAYYTALPDEEAVGAEALRAHLAASLPDYMVPAAYVRLNALPLTANGKLDRKGLPAPDQDAYAARGYAPPEGKTEETLARIWANALKIQRVGRDDNFFELGGDSLLGIQLMFEIERAFGETLPVGVLFSTPTIAGLARHLDHGGKTSGSISLVPLHAGTSGPSIFMVHWIERDLARHLGRRHPVCGLSFGLAAAGGSDALSFPERIEAVASHYVEEMRFVQPHGPYHLIGHSAGGLVAYEMAQQIRGQGETVAFLGLLDTYPHDPAGKRPRLPLARVCRNLLKTPPKKLRWLAVKWMWESVPAWRRMMIKLLPTHLTWRLRLYDTVRPMYSPTPYLGRIHLFRAIDPMSYIFREPPPPPEVVWQRLAVDGLDVHLLPGAHIDIVTDPTAVVTAEAIESALDELANSPA